MVRLASRHSDQAVKQVDHLCCSGQVKKSSLLDCFKAQRLVRQVGETSEEEQEKEKKDAATTKRDVLQKRWLYACE